MVRNYRTVSVPGSILCDKASNRIECDKSRIVDFNPLCIAACDEIPNPRYKKLKFNRDRLSNCNVNKILAVNL